MPIRVNHSNGYARRVRTKPASRATARRLAAIAQLADQRICVGDVCTPLRDLLAELTRRCGADQRCRRAAEALARRIAECGGQEQCMQE